MCAVLHGAFWIANHLRWGLPLIGEQKEGSGMAAMGVLGVVVLASVGIVREKAWSVFYWVQ